MIDKDIIKALETCILGDCDVCNCKCESVGDCRDTLNKQSLDLINRQQAEKETMFTHIKCLEKECDNWHRTAELNANEIIKLQAEIERLQAEEEKYPFKCVMPFNSMVCSKSIEDYDRLIGDIGAEAIKEFAEKCKTELRTGEIIMDKSIRDIIDNLVKEMVGED